MELILEVFGWIIVGFLGALVGLFWTPKSPIWARIRIANVVLLAISAVCFGLSAFIGQKSFFGNLILIGTVLFLVFLVLGNLYRTHHEKKNKEVPNSDKNHKDTSG
jgi:fatty acid desaturase